VELNLTSLALNVIGSFVMATVKAFSKVKFQYLQAYLMLVFLFFSSLIFFFFFFRYEAVSDGFCSCFTTFGNTIEDTGRFLLSGRYLLGLANLFGNLILSFIAYQIGKHFVGLFEVLFVCGYFFV